MNVIYIFVFSISSYENTTIDIIQYEWHEKITERIQMSVGDVVDAHLDMIIIQEEYTNTSGPEEL